MKINALLATLIIVSVTATATPTVVLAQSVGSRITTGPRPRKLLFAPWPTPEERAQELRDQEERRAAEREARKKALAKEKSQRSEEQIDEVRGVMAEKFRQSLIPEVYGEPSPLIRTPPAL